VIDILPRSIDGVDRPAERRRAAARPHDSQLSIRLVVTGLVGLLLAAACQPAPATPAATAEKPAVATTASPATAPVTSPVASPAASPQASPSASPSPSPSAARVVTIEATDFAFNAPDIIPGGLVTLQLRNSGREPHHAQLMRLNTGITVDQFTTALAQGPGPALQLSSLEGGPSVADPGDQSEVVVNLPEGQYVLVCFVESPDGVPHLAKGMVRPLRVTAPPVAATPPTASQTVTLKDFSFESPATLPAGRSIVRVENAGPQPHEMTVLRIGDGKSLTDVQQFFLSPPAGPPPFQSSGGMQGLGQGGSGFAVLNLQPGNYALVCLIPDPASGKSHLELGMSASVSVR
jgi:hypothetical protein